MGQLDGLRPPEDRACPLCKTRHRLRGHGTYRRTARVLADHAVDEDEIPVKRFLCARTGGTVSLLPDFCLPRRRCGPEIVGVLLAALATVGASLSFAYKRLRRDVETVRSAQALVASFLARRPLLENYSAGLRSRAPNAPKKLSSYRREVARLFLPLLQGQRDGAAALRHHGLPFHRQYDLGIA